MPPPPRRVHYAILAAVFVALAVYGSLVPLEFRAFPLSEAWERFRRIPYLELGIESRSDWVANILLFVPLGFLLTAALRVDRPRRLHGLTAAAIVIPACLLLSLGIEFTQIWFPPRTVSQNDIAAEVLGAVVGAGLWSLAGRQLTAFARDYAVALSPRRKLDLILQAYLGGLLVYSVLPLDLTISPADLWRKYRDGKVLLFVIGDGGPAESTYSILSKIVPFVPVGLLASSRLPPCRRRIRDIGRGLALGGLLAAAIEAVQLLVYSRVTNGADILWGGLGVGVGATWRWEWGAINAARGRPARSGRTPIWLGLAVAHALLLVAIFWMPFRFTRDKDLILTRLSELRRPPFAALYWGTDWNAMTQITRKVLWFVPLGILLGRGIVTATKGALGRRLQIQVALLICFAVATAIELGQVFLPDHVADLTDILLYWTGAAVGLLTTARLLDLRAVESQVRSTPPPG